MARLAAGRGWLSCCASVHGMRARGRGLPSPRSWWLLSGPQVTVFLVGAYAKYNWPYVWVSVSPVQRRACMAAACVACLRLRSRPGARQPGHGMSAAAAERQPLPAAAHCSCVPSRTAKAWRRLMHRWTCPAHATGSRTVSRHQRAWGGSPARPTPPVVSLAFLCARTPISSPQLPHAAGSLAGRGAAVPSGPAS
jgi:hypothetical protein